MEAIALIVGVMLFLWSSAVVATGFSFLVTDGRLGRRETYQVALAVAVLVVCIIGFMQLDADVELPPPEDDTTPAIP